MRADGGGVFGLVPKVMWEPKHPSDSLNRVLLRLNCLLVRDGDHTILVDTGVGSKMAPRTRDLMGISRAGELTARLAEHGVEPGQVDLVINTHLHFDHAGGNTVARSKELTPTFPNATYVVQRGEWEDANATNERTRASYIPENLHPLREAGRLELIEGDTQITPHVRCLLTPGHTPNHQSVLIESRGEKLLYLGDLSIFAVHIERLPWVAAYDLDPMRTIETKRRIRQWAVDEQLLLAFPHDPEIGFGRLRCESGRFHVEPVERLG